MITAETPPVTPQAIALRRSAFWFVVVGIVNNVVSYSLFVLLTVAGIVPMIAVTFTYVLGMFISFFGNRRLSFKHKGDTGATAFRFIIVNAVGYSVNLVILWLFVTMAGIPAIVVQLFAIVVVAGITYFSMKLWVFRGPHRD